MTPAPSASAPFPSLCDGSGWLRCGGCAGEDCACRCGGLRECAGCVTCTPTSAELDARLDTSDRAREWMRDERDSE